MHKAILYKKLDNKKVLCTACKQKCIIYPNYTGVCGVRQNRDGELYLLVYGKASAVNIDPIEKKPLFHFLPNTKIFSIGTVGCNFACKFCFTPETTILNDNEVKTFDELFESSEQKIISNIGWIGIINDKKTYTSLGFKKKINKVFKHFYNGNMLTIHPRHTPSIKSTPEHKFLVYKKGKIEKIMAKDLKKGDYLIIPKIKPIKSNKMIETKNILDKYVSKIKKNRKLDESKLKLILKLKENHNYSKDIGKIVGAHPVYIRGLISKLRKKGVDESMFYYYNILIENNQKIKFKLEKGGGIPRFIKINEKLAELFGYYCSEGHTSKYKNRPTSFCTVFSYGKHEKYLINRTVELIKELFGIKARIVKRRTTITVEVNSSSFGIFFIEMCGKKAQYKKVPIIITKSNRNIIHTFLKAFLAGDGCILKDNIAINTVSKKLALGIYQLFLLLGYLPSFYEWVPPKTKIIEGRKVKQSPLYYIKLIAEKYREKFLGNKKYKLRKKSESNLKFKEIKNYWLVPIFKTSIEKYSGYVYNCEVEKEHTYLANFIAVCNCQNWDISQVTKELRIKLVKEKKLNDMDLEIGKYGYELSPNKIVENCIEKEIPSIAYTYNEPIIFFEYLYDTSKLAHKEGIKNVFVSNGYESEEALEMIKPYLNAMNIDLKSFNDDFYKKICNARLQPVLETIKKAYELGIWIEITTLVIPGKNDSDDELKKIADFISNINKNIPWHVTAFHPYYKMTDVPSTSHSILYRAYNIGKKSGLKYVYTGNIIDEKHSSTYCPNCNKLLIKRNNYFINIEKDLDKGKCKNCGEKIPGIWE